ncbi:hypothetical protein PHMEG_00037747 [Phytophthora megakarya]|uniref:Uncharacterized protein n=1 Tax=Phytophthora megakarya TaxID=4795 RepID=A0A225UIG3_9STRA|nr:hypothetical protein PHMEG_00037747 [Phytophthora megakarya]
MKDASPREQSLVKCAFIAMTRGIPRCPPEGEAFVTTRSASEQSKATGESTPEPGADDSEIIGPRIDESGTESAKDGRTVGPIALIPRTPKRTPGCSQRTMEEDLLPPGTRPGTSTPNNAPDQDSGPVCAGLPRRVVLCESKHSRTSPGRCGSSLPGSPPPRTSKRIFCTTVTRISKALIRVSSGPTRDCVKNYTGLGCSRTRNDTSKAAWTASCSEPAK